LSQYNGDNNKGGGGGGGGGIASSFTGAVRQQQWKESRDGTESRFLTHFHSVVEQAGDSELAEYDLETSMMQEGADGLKTSASLADYDVLKCWVRTTVDADSLTIEDEASLVSENFATRFIRRSVNQHVSSYMMRR
jgi:hypothetical protein